jgi:putative ABC transport system permease protein
MEEEMRQHVELEAEELARRGVPVEEARRRALVTFGGVDRYREEGWEARRPRWLEDLARDLRYSLRSLRRAPAFTIMAVLCVGLAIGVTTTIFAVVNGVLLRPLPYPDDEQLVSVYAANPARDATGVNISRPDFDVWQRESYSFAQLGMWTWSTLTLSGGEEAERVDAADVTPNLFPLLGVQPALGRGFVAGEDGGGRENVLLLSWGLWQRRFGGDRGVLGRRVAVDDVPYTVVGVMPERFAFPATGQAWRPLVRDPVNDAHGNRFYAGALGRLRSGVTLAAARAEMARISRDLARAHPADNGDWEAELVPLREDLVGNLRRPLLVLLGAVGCVLLIACGNVANLSLVRGAGRSRELAVRATIGAGRGRVVRQLLTESLTVAVLGALLGGALAAVGVRFAGRAFPNDVPFFVTLGVDRTVLAFVALLAFLTAALFGLLPAWRAGDLQLSSALRDGAAGAGEGRRRVRLRAALVVVEVALSLVLMTGAGLLVKSYLALAGTDLGFAPRGVLSFRVTLPKTRYPHHAQRVAFYDQLLARLAGLPGVESAGAAQGTPFSGWDVQAGIAVENRPAPPPGQEVVALYQNVTPGFFRTMGVSLLRGRGLVAADDDPEAPVVLVNESFARATFGDADPLGARVKIGDLQSEEPWATIVGVVRDYRHYRLPQPMGPAMYYPFHAWSSRTETLVLRTRREDPTSLLPAVREVLRGLDRDVPPYQVATLDQTVARTLWRQRLQGQLLGVFAVLALLLSLVGLYGLVAYTVAQRRREIGVRVALGATRAQVLGVVVGQGARLALRGIALGLLVALPASRLLADLLYEVRPYDLATFVVIPALLAMVAVVASCLPAMSAARLAPQTALRAE